MKTILRKITSAKKEWGYTHIPSVIESYKHYSQLFPYSNACLEFLLALEDAWYIPEKPTFTVMHKCLCLGSHSIIISLTVLRLPDNDTISKLAVFKFWQAMVELFRNEWKWEFKHKKRTVIWCNLPEEEIQGSVKPSLSALVLAVFQLWQHANLSNVKPKALDLSASNSCPHATCLMYSQLSGLQYLYIFKTFRYLMISLDALITKKKLKRNWPYSHRQYDIISFWKLSYSQRNISLFC